MPLLGNTRYDDFEVILEDEVGELQTLQVVAQDAEHAAWSALELSKRQFCTLKDVRPKYEW